MYQPAPLSPQVKQSNNNNNNKNQHLRTTGKKSSAGLEEREREEDKAEKSLLYGRVSDVSARCSQNVILFVCVFVLVYVLKLYDRSSTVVFLFFFLPSLLASSFLVSKANKKKKNGKGEEGDRGNQKSENCYSGSAAHDIRAS